jgi:hypothetical protein
MATTGVVAGDRLASGNVNSQLNQSNPPPLAWGQQTKQQAQGGGDGGMRMSMDVESSTGVREDEAGDAEMR